MAISMDTLPYQNVHQTQNNILLQPDLLLIKFVSLINNIIIIIIEIIVLIVKCYNCMDFILQYIIKAT